MEIWATVWLVSVVFGLLIGSGRQVGAVGGALLGVFLGPIGLAITVFSPARAEGAAAAPESRMTDRIEQRPEAAGWHPDPLGRFTARWFDGVKWTQHVGRVDEDGTHTKLEDPV